MEIQTRAQKRNEGFEAIYIFVVLAALFFLGAAC